MKYYDNMSTSYVFALIFCGKPNVCKLNLQKQRRTKSKYNTEVLRPIIIKTKVWGVSSTFASNFLPSPWTTLKAAVG
jgi:hypothetical protein